MGGYFHTKNLKTGFQISSVGKKKALNLYINLLGK
jgi:hypothetical protein